MLLAGGDALGALVEAAQLIKSGHMGGTQGRGTRLQAPHHVDIVARDAEEGVPPAHRQQRLAPEGRVAPRDVVGRRVVKQHVGGAACAAGGRGDGR